MKKVSFALLGCGNIAHKHAEVIQQHLNDATLTAVCNHSPEKAQAIGERYQVPWFTNIDQMMQCNGDEIDVVTVLTPSGYHAQHVMDLVPYGKHICVEKPMAFSLVDSDKMIPHSLSISMRQS